MKLEYKLDIDDWMDFHEYHLLNNKQFQKTKMMMTYAVPLVFGVYMYYKFQNNELVLENALMVVAMCALWVIFYPKRLVNKAMGRAQMSLENGENAGSLGANEVELSEENLRHKFPETETTLEWDAIKHTIETEASIFLYASATTPVIIPKAKIESLQLTELRQILNDRGLLS